MIIDLDSETSQELSSLLTDEYYEVEITQSLTQAVEKLNDAKFDCIIMDVELPEMDGFKAVSILKAIDPKLQIIMTASENTKELEANVRKQDIFYYYIKSFDTKELMEAVSDVFRKPKKFKEVNMMDNSAKILVVDDDPGFVAAMMPILESKGYEVEAAYDSEEAMDKIEKLKPNLILLDIMMEKLTSGFDLCYKLKQNFELKKIPVLIVSSVHSRFWFNFSPKANGKNCGANDFIEKPIVNPENLLWRVKKLLAG